MASRGFAMRVYNLGSCLARPALTVGHYGYWTKRRSHLVLLVIFITACLMADTLLRKSFLPTCDAITESPDHRYITITGIGRWGIGNELFALASLLGVANTHYNRWRPCFPPSAQIRAMFNLSSIPCCDARDFASVYAVYEAGSAKYQARMTRLPREERHVAIGRFLQSWRYFAHIDAELRRFLRPLPAIETLVQTTLEQALSRHFSGTCDFCLQATCLIGVHVRRGNMEHHPEITRKGYVTAPASYVNNAMQHFREKYQKSELCRARVRGDSGWSKVRYAFILSTDDQAWTRQNLDFSHNDVIDITTSQPFIDMAMLSKCDHSVITVGTFGYMAAWLAGGETVYYKAWPRPGSQLARETNTEDYFPPQWLGAE